MSKYNLRIPQQTHYDHCNVSQWKHHKAYITDTFIVVLLQFQTFPNPTVELSSVISTIRERSGVFYYVRNSVNFDDENYDEHFFHELRRQRC